MRHWVRIVWELVRLAAATARDIPGFYLDRVNAWVANERAKDTLRATAPDAAAVYLYAARGDGRVALALAQCGFDPEQAAGLRDQGFSPSWLRVFAEVWARTTAHQTAREEGE